MKDLADLQPEEQVQVLMDLLEDQQTEIEDRDKTINSQQAQLEESLQLVEKLNSENRKENVTKANEQIEDIQDKLAKAEKEKMDAIRHQKIVEVPVERPVLYEKCRSCNQSEYKKLKTSYERKYQNVEMKFKKKEIAFGGMLMGFMLYSLLITLFMAIHSATFRTDFMTFFTTLWNCTVEFVKATIQIGKVVAEFSNKISNETLSGIVYWLLLLFVIGIVLSGIIGILGFMISKVKYLYHEYCWDKISLIVFISCLAYVVFLGDWIRQVIQINLILLLLVVQMGYVIFRWYVKGCRENRGYY